LVVLGVRKGLRRMGKDGGEALGNSSGGTGKVQRLPEREIPEGGMTPKKMGEEVGTRSYALGACFRPYSADAELVARGNSVA
jgi:hypothetical protein